MLQSNTFLRLRITTVETLTWPRLSLTLCLQPLKQPGVNLAEEVHHLGFGRPAGAAHRSTLGPSNSGAGLLLVRVRGSTASAGDGNDHWGHLLIGQQAPFHSLKWIIGKRVWKNIIFISILYSVSTFTVYHWQQTAEKTGYISCSSVFMYTHTHLCGFPFLVEVSYRHAWAEAEVFPCDSCVLVPLQILRERGTDHG